MRLTTATDSRVAALACYRAAEATKPPARPVAPPPQATAPSLPWCAPAILLGGLAVFVGAPLLWLAVFFSLVTRSCMQSL